jgi:hypothetical protein
MLDQTFHDEVLRCLGDRGMSLAHVEEWAWIVSAPNADEVAERFLSTQSEKPTFLLLEILRRDISHVRTLKSLIIYAWHLLSHYQLRIEHMTESSNDIPEPRNIGSKTSTSRQTPTIELPTAILLISRLLHQARRLWAPALVTISYMVGPIFEILLRQSSCEPKHMDVAVHRRLCNFYNEVLRLLALPASLNPLKSMVYNWRAQRVLLEMAGNFEPQLTLDRESYRAVVQVLVASRKSENESKVASLQTRTWPPWRIDQDGMDAQRSPTDDFSRVILAAMRSKESGYSENSKDQAMSILGGQEPDGSPTIQTRKLIKRRSEPSEHRGTSDLDPNLWAARVEATRDIQEAWSAFQSFEAQGGRPAFKMYHTMLEKLNYESARLGRHKQHDASPGGGKELSPPLDDNFSTFFRQRLSPPSFDDLYDKMIKSGLRPSGRLLDFLVKHAKSLKHAFGYLEDSQIDKQSIVALKGEVELFSGALAKVPTSTVQALIAILCRLSPRAVLAKTAPDSEDCGAGETSSVESEYLLVESRLRSGLHASSLIHSMELLKASKTQHRPSWYALFNALARDGAVIDRSLVGDPSNDLLSWKILVAALDDFHKCGLELDPGMFRILCKGLEKAVFASFKVSLAERVESFAASPVSTVVVEFKKLSEVVEIDSPYDVPRLLHSINGSHLHAYVRVLGLTEDYASLMNLLRWMWRNHEALNEIAIQSPNGMKLIRRVFIAMRVFLDGTGHESEAKGLVESVEAWDGWPQDYEVQKYVDKWKR